MNILVTGGAGYIGSHTSHLLLENGHNVIILDNLSTGHLWAVAPQAVFVHGDIGDSETVEHLIETHNIEAVIHFAAHIEVEESINNPLKYYNNNTANTIRLINSCDKKGVKKFIFSSTAAVYGNAQTTVVNESSPLQPINPYGESKLFSEQCLQSLQLSPSNTLKFVILRYFNVAGASSKYEIGPAHPNASHLIKVACQTALGLRDSLKIFGTDYNTPDGTCIRDYIHVDDLAQAHILALKYLSASGNSITLNCGYGRGFSVKQVLSTFEQATHTNLNIIEAPRRAGDPEALSADNSLIKKILNWQPQYDDLNYICSSAFNWEKKYTSKIKK